MGTCAGLRKRVRELEAAVFGLAAPEVEQIFGRIGRESHVSFGVDLASGKDRTAFMFVGSRHAALMREAMKVQERAGNTSQDKVEAGPVFASANAEDRFVVDGKNERIAELEAQLETTAKTCDGLRERLSLNGKTIWKQSERIKELEAATTEQLERIGKLRELMGAMESGPVYRPIRPDETVCVGDRIFFDGSEGKVTHVHGSSVTLGGDHLVTKTVLRSYCLKRI